MKILEYIKVLHKRNVKHQLTAFAGQIAYFFILSFFPLLIFMLSIISKLDINYDVIIDALIAYLPYNVSLLITDFISQTLDVEGTVILSLSGLIMLFSSSRAVGALQRAVNMSYEVVETRNFFLNKLRGMLYTFLFTIIIILSLLIPTVAINILDFMSRAFHFIVDEKFVFIIQYSRNFLLQFCFVIAIASIYAFLPNKKMRLKDIYPGAIFAIAGSIITNFIFSKIVISLTDYSILYGSLSAMIVFMIWIYLLAQIIILGAEINAIHVTKVNPTETIHEDK